MSLSLHLTLTYNFTFQIQSKISHGLDLSERATDPQARASKRIRILLPLLKTDIFKFT